VAQGTEGAFTNNF